MPQPSVAAHPVAVPCAPDPSRKRSWRRSGVRAAVRRRSAWYDAPRGRGPRRRTSRGRRRAPSMPARCEPERQRPSGRCASSRSRDHLVEEGRDVIEGGGGSEDLRVAVQPSRSSRCGQSVGMSRKLPRMAPDDVRVEPVGGLSEHSNVPTRSRSLASTTAMTDLGRVRPASRSPRRNGNRGT